MSTQLSLRDRDLIREYKKAGILQDVNKHRLDQDQGVILVTCADGDRFPDIFNFQVKLQEHCRPHPRIHPLSWHGGAITCIPRSPVNTRRDSHLTFLDQIKAAPGLKDINLIALYAHAPCGAASLAGLSVEQVIALQIKAKKRIKALNTGAKVVCFFHIDHGEEKKRTNFLSRDLWEDHYKKGEVGMML
jgi:hypothetical protein